MNESKIGLGGGCHWCTEGVFSIIRGVTQIEQGWIASVAPNNEFSEAVIVHFNSEVALKSLIEVHLATHSSTSDHAMREKYRSSIYTFSQVQTEIAIEIMDKIRRETDTEFITQVLPFDQFQPSTEDYQNYYQTDPKRPFCQTYIAPKIKNLRDRYSTLVDEKLIN